MNKTIQNYVAVEGLDNALKVAKVLIEQDYQVMVQLDDCNIYVVAYESNEEWGNKFYSLDTDEQEMVLFKRTNDEVENAKKLLKTRDNSCDN